MSDEEWVNPYDPDAEITRLKDWRTALAYKSEQAVDMEAGAIVGVTTQGGACGDTESNGETLPAAAEAVAEQIAETTPDGEYAVNFPGVEEVVADKGDHSNEVLRHLRELGVRTRADLYRRAGNAGFANGTVKRWNKRPCMPIDGEFEERGQSGCRLVGASGSNATLRVSSVPEAWTGCM